MRARRFLIVATAFPLLALPVLAQQGPAGDIAILYRVQPRPGVSAQFEAGAKKHVEWHKQQKDTWAWEAWEVLTGENFGQIVWRSGNHRWEHFDSALEFRADDDADAQANIVPYSSSVVSWYSRVHRDLTHWPDTTPSAMISVTEYHLNPGGEGDFLYTVRKIHDALQKAKSPFKYLIASTVSGGEVPTFVVVSPRANWAAMNPPEKNFLAYVEEAYGRQEAEELLQKFFKTVHCMRGNILRYRADLSYSPPAQAAK